MSVLCLCSSRTPAMIGCSFVVDREYFGQIGLLDPGMEVYGGENIELGMRVGNHRLLLPLLVLMNLMTVSVIDCMFTALLTLGTSRMWSRWPGTGNSRHICRQRSDLNTHDRHCQGNIRCLDSRLTGRPMIHICFLSYKRFQSEKISDFKHFF